MTDENGKGFEGFAVIELFGHKRMAGYVSSQEIGGGSLIRIDVPATEPEPHEIGKWQEHPTYYAEPKPTQAYSKFLGLGAIYGITPCTEEVARRAARAIERSNDPLPVQLPALTAAAATEPGGDLGIREIDYEEEDEEEEEER